MSDFADFRRSMLDWYEECVRYDGTQADRLNRFRNLEPESAQLLLQFVLAQQSLKVLEIGTSNGFSTAWLAYAIRQISGHLTTVEIEQKRSTLAQHKLVDLKLHQNVEFVVTDAAHFLKTAEADYTFIFLDAERKYYADYIHDLKRLLSAKSGHTLIVDNVISHAQEVEHFLQSFKDDPKFICSTLAIGAGIFIATFNG